MNAEAALSRHHAELARAGAAAMQRHYQETIEVCSDLLTSGIYDDVAAADPESARRCRAEARLIMATAMHYNEAHYEDIVRVLTAALDSPAEIQKDALFTLAVLHVSFDREDEAHASMEKCIALIEILRKKETGDFEELNALEKEAQHFLKQLGHSPRARKAYRNH